MNSFNPDQLMLIVFVCAVPLLIIFMKRSNAMFFDLAQYYNGKVFSPYFGIALGVEIPFREFTVIFDPYDTVSSPSKNQRTKRSSLIWEMAKPLGVKKLSIERNDPGFRIRALALAKKIQTNDALFDGEYEVFCREEAAALAFLTSEVREALIGKREIVYALEIEDDRLILRHKELLRERDRFRSFIDEGMEVINRIYNVIR